MGQKTLFLGQKVWKKFRNRGFRTFGIYGKFGIEQLYSKLYKNYKK